MTPKPAPKAKAYSYIRFSTPEQLKGKSLERQTEASTKWCKENNVELDTELSLQDLGVSAFRGKNSDTGALGQFLKAIDAGAVPRGSYLLIEAFDRMSRESAYDAQRTLQNIIHAGITVVTLMDGKQYNVTILRADPIALIYAILLMSRSHDESATKARRVADAWARKRTDATKGRIITAMAPFWIKLDKDRKPKVVAAQAKLVQFMFRRALEGDGTYIIATELNKRGIKTIRSKKAWTPSHVFRILRYRAAIGEFQSHKIDHNGRKVTRTPVGEPITNYWPMIIDRRTFEKVQVRLQERRATPRLRGRKPRNILAGLGRCPKCDGVMARVLKTAGKPRLVCSQARLGTGCSFHSVTMETVENTLVEAAERLTIEVPETDDTLGKQITLTEARLKTSQDKIFDFALLLDGTPSKTIAEKVQNEEQTIERLSQDLEVLRRRQLKNGARLIRDNARRMQEALAWFKADSTDVVSVNDALRECFEKIVVDYASKQLHLHWRHGPVSSLTYASSSDTASLPRDPKTPRYQAAR
jgi:DNA invertase Pin-like site-specific DNA recombinase/guanylate kinase